MAKAGDGTVFRVEQVLSGIDETKSPSEVKQLRKVVRKSLNTSKKIKHKGVRRKKTI